MHNDEFSKAMAAQRRRFKLTMAAIFIAYFAVLWWLGGDFVDAVAQHKRAQTLPPATVVHVPAGAVVIVQDGRVTVVDQAASQPASIGPR